MCILCVGEDLCQFSWHAVDERSGHSLVQHISMIFIKIILCQQPAIPIHPFARQSTFIPTLLALNLSHIKGIPQLKFTFADSLVT